MALSITAVHSPTQFYENHSKNFRVILLMDKQTNKHMAGQSEYIPSLAEAIMQDVMAILGKQWPTAQKPTV